MGRCNPEVTSKKYTGKVYCATVPAGNIVVRRNGKPIIVGNCHELIPMLQDFEGIKIWKHLTPYPSNIRTAAELLMWAASRGPKDKLGRKIGKLLGKNPMDYTIVHEEAAYRGHTRDCLRIYPLTPKNNAPILWPPSKVRKLVLMSATIAPPDIEDLGLHRRRVGYIEVPSDIPVERRKFIYAGVGSMGQANQTENIKRAVDKLIDIRSKHQLRRGFVHSTYGLARKIPDMPWLLKHDSVNKQQVLQRWLETVEDNRVFLGCGLTTGLDLKGGLASWQAIMKCQFPDLGDPAVMAKATNNPEWYQWVTIRQIVQAYGRVCRAPNDEGTTYILDSDFAMLYNKANHLFPQWFKEAIEWGL